MRRVGDGDAEDVAGEIVEHGLLSLAPGGAMDDPGLRPGGLGQDQVGPALLRTRPGACRAPAWRGPWPGRGSSCGPDASGAVLGHAAAGDQAVDVRVEEELLGPGVQHGEHADGAADEARIAGQLDDRLGGGLHQHGVAVALVGAQHGPQFLGHGDGDVEVGHRQHLGLRACRASARSARRGTSGSSGSCRNGRRRPRRRTGRSARGVRRALRSGRRGCRRWRADAMAASTRHGPPDSRPRSGGRRPRLDHGRRRRQRPLITLSSSLSEIAGRLGQVGVDGVVAMFSWPSRIWTTRVSTPLLEEPGRIAVAQRMRRDPVRDAGRPGGGPEGAAQDMLC